MSTKRLGLALLVVAVLGIGFAQSSLKSIGKPLPKPVPISCPSDLLCW